MVAKHDMEITLIWFYSHKDNWWYCKYSDNGWCYCKLLHVIGNWAPTDARGHNELVLLQFPLLFITPI